MDSKDFTILSVSKEQMTILVDDIVMVVNHHYTGTQTIQDVYEDFFKRKLESPSS